MGRILMGCFLEALYNSLDKGIYKKLAQTVTKTGEGLGFISLGANEVSEEQRPPSWRKPIGY